MEEDKNKTESVIQSFNSTFESGNLIDTLSQIGEVGVDFAMDFAEAAPIVKDIPVLGLIVSGTKTIANIRSYSLAKKVFRFFMALRIYLLRKGKSLQKSIA